MSSLYRQQTKFRSNHVYIYNNTSSHASASALLLARTPELMFKSRDTANNLIVVNGVHSDVSRAKDLQAFDTVQTYGAMQTVPPVQPVPPHCPECATVPPVLLVEVGTCALVLIVVEVGFVVVTGAVAD